MRVFAPFAVPSHNSDLPDTFDVVAPTGYHWAATGGSHVLESVACPPSSWAINPSGSLTPVGDYRPCMILHPCAPGCPCLDNV